MRTTTMLTREDALANRRWFVIDAREQGASVALPLRPRSPTRQAVDRPSLPMWDCGDFVVVVNAPASWAHRRRRKARRSPPAYGIPGRDPVAVGGGVGAENIRTGSSASRSMECCPRTASGGSSRRSSKVYPDAEHPHAAQQPKVIGSTRAAASEVRKQ